MQRRIESELIPCCRRYGLSLVIYSPLAGGLFSGNITRAHVTAAPTDGRFSDNFLNGWMRSLYFKDATFDALDALKHAAEKAGTSMIEVAMRWLVWHSEIDVYGNREKNKGQGDRENRDGIIIGVSKLEHLEVNLDAILEKGPLEREVLEAVDRVHKVAGTESWDYWVGGLEYGYDTQEVLFGNRE